MCAHRYNDLYVTYNRLIPEKVPELQEDVIYSYQEL